MKSLESTVLISASPQKIWQVLMDFEKYPEWNPFINIAGEAKVGATLKNTIMLEGRSPQVFQPQVLVVEEQRELRWLGKLLISGLFDGEHYFLLEPVDDRTTQLIHGENFKGIFVGPIMKMIGEQTKTGFEKMNMALKERAEANPDYS